MKKLLYIIISITLMHDSHAQILSSNGAIISVSTNALIYCNGGILISNNSSVTNNGTVTTTLNSTLPQQGNFLLDGNSTIQGDGLYRVEQNWINDANFVADNSTVELFGNQQQFIASNTNTVTTFNNLNLTGTGTLADRSKTLLNVDARTSVTGILNINDRELNTSIYSFYVDNSDSSAVLYDDTFNNEGLVTSAIDGYFVRATTQAKEYIFPVGSSTNTRRFRPVTIHPNATTATQFAVRMNNHSATDDGYLVTQHESAISSVNDLFYHTIEQIGATTNPHFSIYYIPTDDQFWGGIGNWKTQQNQWRDVTQVGAGLTPDFNFMTKYSYVMSPTDKQYVLINPNSPSNPNPDPSPSTPLDSYISVPNVFTPNGDGVNDYFLVTNSNILDYTITIVNRWGEIVFITTDPNEHWDGKTGGKNCPDGVYFYTLKATIAGEQVKKHGHITLNSN